MIIELKLYIKHNHSRDLLNDEIHSIGTYTIQIYNELSCSVFTFLKLVYKLSIRSKYDKTKK